MLKCFSSCIDDGIFAAIIGEISPRNGRESTSMAQRAGRNARFRNEAEVGLQSVGRVVAVVSDFMYVNKRSRGKRERFHVASVLFLLTLVLFNVSYVTIWMLTWMPCLRLSTH